MTEALPASIDVSPRSTDHMESLLAAQEHVAGLFDDVLAAWHCIRGNPAFRWMLDLPVGWIGTNLLLELCDLSACALSIVTEFDAHGRRDVAGLDAIGRAIGFDARVALAGIEQEIADAFGRGDEVEYQRAIARFACESRRLSALALQHIRQIPFPIGTYVTLWHSTLQTAINTFRNARFCGDPSASRALEFLVAMESDFGDKRTARAFAGGAERIPLEDTDLPLKVFQGRGSPERSLNHQVDYISRQVFRDTCAPTPSRVVAGVVLLLVAFSDGLAVATTTVGKSRQVGFADALRQCWDLAEAESDLVGDDRGRAMVKKFILRAQTALGAKARAAVGAPKKRTQRQDKSDKLKNSYAVDRERWRQSVRPVLLETKAVNGLAANRLGLRLADLKEQIDGDTEVKAWSEAGFPRGVPFGAPRRPCGEKRRAQ
jgi:hypothetical protein